MRSIQPFRARLLLALTLAPILPGLLLLVLAFIFSSGLEGLWALQTAALIGYPTALVLGVPTYLFSQKMGWRGLLFYAGVSLLFSLALIGALIVFPTLVSAGSDYGALLAPARLAQMTIIVVSSTVSCIGFWLIARPDRIG